MPAAVILADLAEARQFQRLVMWLLDLPKAPVNIGGGFHAPLPPRPDDATVDAPGWTTREVPFIRHPSDGRFAVRITPRLRAAWQARNGQVRAPVRTWVISRLATEGELPADWLVGGEPLEDASPVPDGTQIGS